MARFLASASELHESALAQGRREGLSARLPRYLLIGAVAYLLMAFGLSYAVDVHDAWGLRSRMLAANMDHPALWYHFFAEGKLTEMLQWAMLGGAVVAAAQHAGQLGGPGSSRDARFWSLLAAGMAIMLIEDAGNFRHTIAGYPADLLPDFEYVRRLVTMAIMAGIAAVPLAALFWFGSGPLRTRGVRGFLLLGFIAYGIAATTSATSHFTGLYDALGTWIYEAVAKGDLVLLGRSPEAFGSLLGDTVVEESIELIGAAGLLAAALAALRQDTERLAAKHSRPDLMAKAKMHPGLQSGGRC